MCAMRYKSEENPKDEQMYLLLSRTHLETKWKKQRLKQ